MDRRTVPDRQDIDAADRWRLEHIFESDEAWEQAFRAVERAIEPLAAFAGTLGQGPEVLDRALAAWCQLEEELGRVYVYSGLSRDQDTRHAEAQARSERASRLATRVNEATAFLEPEILALPEDQLEAYLASSVLEPWRHHLENLIRLRKHTLTPREEAILAMAGEVSSVPRTAFGMLNDADLTFASIRDENGDEIEVTKGRYTLLLECLDRRVREDAWNSLTDGYEAHKNTVASLLGGSVKRDVFYSRVRHYDSALDAALAGSKIPRSVYETQIETIDARREAVHRYVGLRKRVLGIDEVHPHDLYVPLSSAEPPRFDYGQACDMLLEGLAPLGDVYLRDLKASFSAGWIDVYETRGKRSGAYSWGAYGAHPYVLMNYQGTLDHVFTLAHEMGHAMHSFYSNAEQPYIYSHYPIFLAEVASTTNEVLLMEHLLKTCDDPDWKLSLLNQYVDQIRGTVVTQIMFAEFELKLHEMAERGDALTWETISEVYREIFVRMLGPDLVFNERAALGWARIPHFHNGFYVYQYATGYAAAVALARRVLAGGEVERNDYLGFLQAGCSDYPIEILKRAGVDLTTPKPLGDTLDLFEELLDQVEEHISTHGTAAVGG